MSTQKLSTNYNVRIWTSQIHAGTHRLGCKNAHTNTEPKSDDYIDLNAKRIKTIFEEIVSLLLN